MKYQLEYYCGQTIRNVVVEKGHWQGDAPFIRCDGYGLSKEIEMEPFKPYFPHTPCPKCGLTIPVNHMTWFRTDGYSMVCSSRTISTSTTLQAQAEKFVYAWGVFCMTVARATGLYWLIDWLEKKLRKLLGKDKDA